MKGRRPAQADAAPAAGNAPVIRPILEATAAIGTPMENAVIKDLARLMQQIAVKQAMQECALRRLLALLPKDTAQALANTLRQDAAVVMDSFSGGIDQANVDATITSELNAMLKALDAEG